MQCPECRFDNPKDSKFCNQCGARLALTCTKCNQANPTGSRFCNQCGYSLRSTSKSPAPDYSQPNSYTPSYLAEKILQLRNSIEGERKQVSVLFCDISNATHLAEQLGAEAFHSIVSRFFELSLAEVHRYEGTINQFLGDGFMALFGAPIA
ncbi:MAG TPA: zinc ribbon domain-containing protein, partial [Desulfobacterales bacterium]